MGQLPGTHWYHAHKHGSTAINVANGMTGAFIIEGKYDDDLNNAYRSYILERNGRKEAWNTRSQPVLVLNQLATNLNPTSGPGGTSWADLDFVVNGRIRPKLRMQPGEVQLWRIVNTSGRSAAYFMAPGGLKWMQVARDGVQLEDSNFKQSADRPFYLAPANRVDLLVQAPMQETSFDVRIQNVMARQAVDPAPAAQGTVLLAVEVAGPSVTKDDKPTQMPFLDKAFDLPEFIAKDIDDDELKQNNFTKRKFVFESKSPQAPVQHTINDIQFNEGHAHVTVQLSSVEEWTIENRTTSAIDHPFHIHINPFQVTEVFDPNEKFVSGTTGNVLARYVIAGTPIEEPNEQCSLDPSNQATWQQCKPKKDKFVWHDVYAMPSARPEGSVVIPGHFKMRSRFVDYPGLYVMHCHILIHEDRGMMYSVQVAKAKGVPIQHH
jgi:FtsP/CotA-like multicopper oxidase with cupredoxin domain